MGVEVPTQSDLTFVCLHEREGSLARLFQCPVHAARRLQLAGPGGNAHFDSVDSDLAFLCANGGGVDDSGRRWILGDQVPSAFFRHRDKPLFLGRAVDVTEARS